MIGTDVARPDTPKQNRLKVIPCHYHHSTASVKFPATLDVQGLRPLFEGSWFFQNTERHTAVKEEV